MKLNIALSALCILQTQAKETRMYLECYNKVDCKVLDFMKDAIESGKTLKCGNISVLEDAAKCQLESYGLSKDQAELTWKLYPHIKQCAPKPDTEFKTCTARCNKQKDRDSCLESCALPPKVKSEECLEKLARKTTSNASKNAKCMMDCDKNSFSEIFECQYNCHKDVLDALAGKNSGKMEDSNDSDKLDGDSDHKSTDEATNTGSSGPQTKPTRSSQSQSGSSGQSSAYLITQARSLAVLITLILLQYLLINI